jgi:type II secretory pathway pseudopilin PulG
MVNITIEYMILTPVLILLIFLLPFTANAIMNTYVESRQNLELQKVAANLASSIQQVYFSLNTKTLASGSINASLGIPPLLEGLTYKVNGTSRIDLDSNATIVDLNLRLAGGSMDNVSVTLGKNAHWDNSGFLSNSATAYLSATIQDNVIHISFKP